MANIERVKRLDLFFDSSLFVVVYDFYLVFKQAEVSKVTGGIHDFVEILNSDDKNEDNTFFTNELVMLFTNLGYCVQCGPGPK